MAGLARGSRCPGSGVLSLRIIAAISEVSFLLSPLPIPLTGLPKMSLMTCKEKKSLPLINPVPMTSGFLFHFFGVDGVSPFSVSLSGHAAMLMI